MKKLSAGFTLIEAMIYVAMISLVLVSATIFALEFVSARSKAASVAEVAANARVSFTRMATEIREASNLDIAGSTFGSSPGILSLNTASGATNPTIFDVSGGTLRIKRGAGPVTALTSPQVEVTEFLVENVSTTGRTRAVRLKLKVRYRNPDNIQELIAETTLETTVKIWAADGFSS